MNRILGIQINLIYAIICYSLGGIYSEIQATLVSTITDAINSMNNYTLINHYDLEPTQSRIAFMTSITTSIGSIGLLLSLFFIVPKIDIKGRKYVCVYTRFLLSFSSSLLQLGAAVFKASELFIISQVVIGAQIPIRLMLTAIYIGECAPDNQRGFATTSLVIFEIVASVIMYSLTSPNLLGKPDSWFLFPFFTLILSIIVLILTMKLPESPKWLIRVNRMSEAEQSIKFFHGENCNVDAVVSSLIREKNLTIEDKLSLNEIWHNETLREALKIVLAVAGFTFISPSPIEHIYTVSLHTLAGFSINDTLMINLFLCVVFFPTRFIGTFLIDNIGRRPVLFLSFLIMTSKIWIMTITQVIIFYAEPSILTKTLCIYDYITKNNFMRKITVLISDGLTEGLSALGSKSIHTLLILELFPPSARTAVAQVILLIGLISNIPFVFMFPFISSIFPPAFYIPFIVLQPFIMVYIYKHLPETKSRAVCEIIENFDENVISRRCSSINEKTQLLRKRSRTLENPRHYIMGINRSRAISCYDSTKYDYIT